MAELPTETSIDPRLRAYLDAELRHAEADFARLPLPTPRGRRSLAPYASLLVAAAVILLFATGAPYAAVTAPAGTMSVPPGPSGPTASPDADPAPGSASAGPSASSVPMPSGRLPVATLPPGAGVGDALFGGKLEGQTTGGTACFWVTTPGARTALVWPSGFSAAVDPLAILGPDGQTLARPGDSISLGGGSPIGGASPAPELDPCGLGAVFNVASVVSVNGTEVNIGEGSLRLTTQASPQGTCSASVLPPQILVMSGGHLRLRATDGTDHDVVWPSGFSARAGNRITVVDSAGRVAATLGVEVTNLRGELQADVVVVCGVGSTTATAAPTPDLSGQAWYTVSAFGGCPANAPAEPLSACSDGGPSRPGYLELLAGTLDGRTSVHVDRSLRASAGLWVGRGSLPSASGPFGTKILYWLFDGTQSELHVADAVSSRDDTALTTRAVIYGAVLDPASGAVYYNPLDASSRHDLGIWRLDAGATVPTLLVPPASHAYTGSQQWDRQLLLTPDGTRLAVRDCEDLSCAVAVYGTADGVLVTRAIGLADDTVYGATDAELVVGLGCGSGCAIGEVDLASGTVRAITTDPCTASGSGQLGASQDGSPLLLVSAASTAGCAGPTTVLSVDLTTGTVATVWAGAPSGASGDGLGLATRGDGYQGYSAPAGWTLLAPTGSLARTNHTGSLVPQLVSLSGGTEVPVGVQPQFSR